MMRFKPRNMLVALTATLAICGLTAASALAAGAPIVETKPASLIRGTTAYLNGVVNPNGAETKDYFEYGTTVAYGSKSREQTTSVEKKPSILVAGLQTRTTYHFRMVATNSYGTSYGADEVFSTLAEKPEIVLSEGSLYEFEFRLQGSEVLLEWDGRKSMICTGSHFLGHAINAREIEGRMTWEECYGGNLECANVKSREVQSELLKGTLGYINRAKKEVGLRLAGKSSEIWANNVRCPGGVAPLTGSLGGLLALPVNTKIPITKEFGLVYTEQEEKQTTGELGGQLLWITGDFGIDDSPHGFANKEFEIQA